MKFVSRRRLSGRYDSILSTDRHRRLPQSRRSASIRPIEAHGVDIEEVEAREIRFGTGERNRRRRRATDAIITSRHREQTCQPGSDPRDLSLMPTTL